MNLILEIIRSVLGALVFPGIVFTLFMSFWLAGMDRVLVARMQRRVGPPLLQPVWDVLKCCGKETLIPRKANKTVYIAAPLLGLASVFVTAMFLPAAGFKAFEMNADVIVVLYLLTFAGVMLIVGSAASGSPFAGVGLSREMVAVISYELPLVLVLLAVGRCAANGTAVTFSLTEISDWQRSFGPLILKPSLLPAAAAMLFVIPCEAGQQPLDIDEAETEICEGVLAEYSGTPLAMFKMMHNIKMYIMSGLFCALFLNIQTGFFPLDVILYAVSCTLVAFCSMSIPHAIMARLRVEQVFRFYWTGVTGLAALSLVLVWLGL